MFSKLLTQSNAYLSTIYLHISLVSLCVVVSIIANIKFAYSELSITMSNQFNFKIFNSKWWYSEINCNGLSWNLLFSFCIMSSRARRLTGAIDSVNSNMHQKFSKYALLPYFSINRQRAKNICLYDNFVLNF